MLTHEQVLQNIKIQIYKFLPDCQIILFGSRARNEEKMDSDYDILIITEKSYPIAEKREMRTKIRKSLLNFDILSDILIQSKTDVDIKRQLPGHIVKNAMREGIIFK